MISGTGMGSQCCRPDCGPIGSLSQLAVARVIAVTSYWTAREIAADLDPITTISLMDPHTCGYSIPAGLSLREHIKLGLHDVISDQGSLSEKYVAPSSAHVGQ